MSLEQVIFAFARLHPSIASIAECSVLEVFRYQQIYQVKTSETNWQNIQVS